jgi:hypothetical protein
MAQLAVPPVRRDRYSSAASEPTPRDTPTPTSRITAAETPSAPRRVATAHATATSKPPTSDARSATRSAAGPTRATTAGPRVAENTTRAIQVATANPATPVPTAASTLHIHHQPDSPAAPGFSGNAALNSIRPRSSHPPPSDPTPNPVRYTFAVSVGDHQTGAADTRPSVPPAPSRESNGAEEKEPT